MMATPTLNSDRLRVEFWYDMKKWLSPGEWMRTPPPVCGPYKPWRRQLPALPTLGDPNPTERWEYATDADFLTM